MSLDARDTVGVAAVFAKTGKVAMGTETMLEALRFAVAELNRAGGLLGREVELIEIDTRGTAIGSMLAAHQAVESGAIAVMGANWSSHSLAMAPVLQRAGVPMISPISTHPDVTRVGDYVFRVCFTDPFQSRVLASFAIDDLGAATAGMLVNVADRYSEGLADSFAEAYTRRGGEILFVEEYLEKQSDFSAFLRSARSHDPDVLFHPGHTKVSAFVLRQARAAGLETTFLGGDGWNDLMYRIAGEAVVGGYYVNHWHPDSSRPESRRFVEAYLARSKVPDPASALAHDAVFLLADAVRRARSLDRREIRDALAATRSFEGVTGSIAFDANGDPVKPAVILRFAGESSELVKTVEP